MTYRALFSLEVNDLTNLGPDLAVDSFRRLIWAEAARVGIGKNIIDVPDCINVGDGGIDAYIENASPTSDEVIPAGTSGFQIKSSDLSPTDCKKELHVKGSLDQPIKPRIKRILSNDGTYILVLFADITNSDDKKKAIEEELKRCGYTNPKIRLYNANQISAFIESFPALIFNFKNDSIYCIPFNEWMNCDDIKRPSLYIFDENRQKIANEITTQLRNQNGKSVIYRIFGLSGIGKTRFVFEILKPDDFRSRVIYVRADQFMSSPLYNKLLMEQNLSAIIVIDECSLEQHRQIVNSFANRGNRIALITLSYEFGEVPFPSLSYEITRLNQGSIKKIVRAEAAGLPENIIDRISQFADGYPRIATLLAESYLINQEDFLNISDYALMERLIGGRDTCTDYFRKTKRVLQGLSLFSKVGFEGKLFKECECVGKIIEINLNEIRGIVSEQRKRGIIQGSNYIYVTPFMLRIYLLREWWDSQSFTKEGFLEFAESIPKEFKLDLLQRFFENIPYTTSVKKGKEFSETVLSSDGIFADGSLIKTDIGGDFFLNLTEGDPESALKCLKDTIGKWTKEEFLNFKEGRRYVVWALEKIAVWKEFFSEASRLLLTLAEVENESYSNNATGVFINLFSPGPDRVAPTELSPEERFPILVEAINSTSKEKRIIALNACDKALETGHFSRIAGPEYQGLKVAKLWKPKSREEVINYYKNVWKLIYSELDSLENDEKSKAIGILLNNSKGLTYITDLADMVILNIKNLIDKPYSDKKEILKTIESILYFDKNRLPDNVRKQWEKLRDNLVGCDFSSLMRRYVGMDLIEDKFDQDKKRVDKVGEQIDKLVKQAIKDNNLLITELPWLVTQEAANGFRFGYELGRQDKDLALLPICLEAQKKVINNKDAIDYFLSGYLKALFEINPDKWELVLDELAKDKNFATWVPSLTWRSGMSEKAAIRILNLANTGIIASGHFRLFGYGGVVGQVPEKIFVKWIEFLIQSPYDYAASIALQLYYYFYLRDDVTRKLPKTLTFKILTHPSLFKKPTEGNRNQMDDYYWTEICVKFMELYPEKDLELADVILENFSNDGSILEGHGTETNKIINLISQKYPKEIWVKITKYLGPPIDARAFNIKEWLRGEGLFEEEEGQLSVFPPEMVWGWVDQNIEKHAWYLASFVPKVLFRQEDKVCWAREVLVRYGNRRDVQSNLAANFSTEGWWGPASLHYQKKKDELLAFKKEENNPNVIKWINDYISDLDKRIENEIIYEERRRE